MTTSGLEERMARLEGAYEQITFRLARLEDRVDIGFSELRAEIGGVRGEIGSVRSEMRSEIGGLRSEMRSEIGGLRKEIRNQLFWILGLLIPMWITIIVTLLLRA